MGCYYDYLMDNSFIKPRLMYSEFNGNKHSLPRSLSTFFEKRPHAHFPINAMIPAPNNIQATMYSN